MEQEEFVKALEEMKKPVDEARKADPEKKEHYFENVYNAASEALKNISSLFGSVQKEYILPVYVNRTSDSIVEINRNLYRAQYRCEGTPGLDDGAHMKKYLRLREDFLEQIEEENKKDLRNAAPVIVDLISDLQNNAQFYNARYEAFYELEENIWELDVHEGDVGDRYIKRMNEEAMKQIQNKDDPAATGTEMLYPRYLLQMKAVRTVLDNMAKEIKSKYIQAEIKKLCGDVDKFAVYTLDDSQLSSYDHAMEIKYKSIPAGEKRLRAYVRDETEQNLEDKEMSEKYAGEMEFESADCIKAARILHIDDKDRQAAFNITKAVGRRDALREMGYEEEAVAIDQYLVSEIEEDSDRKTYFRLDAEDRQYAVYTPLQNIVMRDADCQTQNSEMNRQYYINDFFENAGGDIHGYAMKILDDLEGRAEDVAGHIKRDLNADFYKRMLTESRYAKAALYNAFRYVAYAEKGQIEDDDRKLLNKIITSIDTKYLVFPDVNKDRGPYRLMGVEGNYSNEEQKNRVTYGLMTMMQDVCCTKRDMLEAGMQAEKDIYYAGTKTKDKKNGEQLFSKMLYLVCMDAEMTVDKTAASLNGSELYDINVCKELYDYNAKEVSRYKDISILTDILDKANRNEIKEMKEIAAGGEKEKTIER